MCSLNRFDLLIASVSFLLFDLLKLKMFIYSFGFTTLLLFHFFLSCLYLIPHVSLQKIDIFQCVVSFILLVLLCFNVSLPYFDVFNVFDCNSLRCSTCLQSQGSLTLFELLGQRGSLKYLMFYIIWCMFHYKISDVFHYMIKVFHYPLLLVAYKMLVH